MGGGIRYRFQLAFAAGLFLLSSFFYSFPLPAANAAAPLYDLQDVISTTQLGIKNVSHYISFLLPPASQQVTPSDWITIEMPDFTNLTPPTEVVGGFGNPIFSVQGTTLRITNMALLPGGSLQILGATAQNPQQADQNFDVTVKVLDQSSSGLVRNMSSTEAGPGTSLILVSASIASPLSSLFLTGYTSPNSFISLSENNAVVGTTTSTGNGAFVFNISGLNPGDHTYFITASDTNNRSTSQVAEQLFLLSGTETTVTGILLSPTLSLSATQISPGDTLTVSGAAIPNAQVSLFVESPLKSYTVTTDVNGDWSYTLPSSETSTYSPGQYRVYSLVQDSSNNQSLVSQTLNFTVQAPQDNNPPPACDISHGDLNCDGKTNLTDFSILLYHWHTNHKVADINSDGTVNLVDFSIMMFYFRR